MEEEPFVGESSSFSSSELSFFVDRAIVLQSIAVICDENLTKEWDHRWNVLRTSLSKYQEQPLLLNPSLEEMMAPLCSRLLFLSEQIVGLETDSSGVYGDTKVTRLWLFPQPNHFVYF